MSILSQVQTGKKIGPPRAVIYGEPKAGKTTLLADIPGIVVVPTEDGQGTLDYATTPQPDDYETLIDTLVELASADHPYRAVGIDGLSGVEELIREYVVRTEFEGKLEKFMAYHKGYTHTAAVWVEFCRHLDAIRRWGISIWCTAHSKLATIDDVSTGSYSRMTPSLHEKSLEVVAKWADIIGFLEIERFGAERSVAKGSKATLTSQSTGVRRLVVEDTGSHMAGNRYRLGSPIPVPLEHPYGPLRAALFEATGLGKKKAEEAPAANTTTNEEEA